MGFADTWRSATPGGSKSYWDAAIIESARVMKCEVVLSEDMGHGRDFDGVRVVNPFAPA